MNDESMTALRLAAEELSVEHSETRTPALVFTSECAKRGRNRKLSRALMCRSRRGPTIGGNLCFARFLSAPSP